MHADYLVTMANQIADFFLSEAGTDAAPLEIASHMTKFWDPRMRAQMIAHVVAGGDGLQPAALAAARLLKLPAGTASA